MLHNSCLITFKWVLVDISNVLHCQSKHRVFGAIQTDGRHSIPASFPVHVDVNSSSNISILHVELRGSNDNVLPSGPKSRTDYCIVRVFVWMFLSLRVKVVPTCHRQGQPQPHRIQRRRPVLARKRCALPRVWMRCHSLSSIGAQLHCDWLWVHQPPVSGPNCWWLCVPSPGRILGRDITVICQWHWF